MDDRTEIIHSFAEWRRIHMIVESMDPQGEPTLKFVHRAGEAVSGSHPAVAALPAAFNPLTAAHVELLAAADERKRPSELILILDKKTIDKELYGASLEDRLIMLELFARDDERISVGFSSHGLFVDKARAFRKIFPVGVELYFIVGYDTLVRLFDPVYYGNRDEALDNLFSISRFLVANRGESDEDSLNELLSIPRNRRYRDFLEPIRISEGAAAISSTEVRETIGRKGEFGRLVPPPVEYFIRETGLYAAEKEGAEARRNSPVSRYEVRSDIMKALFSADVPEGEDLQVGKMVEAVLRGEDKGKVIERFLNRLDYRKSS
jgi:nicotinamide-nucleotide adenylyltransferase